MAVGIDGITNYVPATHERPGPAGIPGDGTEKALQGSIHEKLVARILGHGNDENEGCDGSHAGTAQLFVAKRCHARNDHEAARLAKRRGGGGRGVELPKALQADTGGSRAARLANAVLGDIKENGGVEFDG